MSSRPPTRSFASARTSSGCRPARWSNCCRSRRATTSSCSSGHRPLEVVAITTETDARAGDFIAFTADVFADVGHPMQPGARVLDFGCGDGSMVDAFLEAGYDAMGCDIELTSE